MRPMRSAIGRLAIAWRTEQKDAAARIDRRADLPQDALVDDQIRERLADRALVDDKVLERLLEHRLVIDRQRHRCGPGVLAAVKRLRAPFRGPLVEMAY